MTTVSSEEDWNHLYNLKVLEPQKRFRYSNEELDAMPNDPMMGMSRWTKFKVRRMCRLGFHSFVWRCAKTGMYVSLPVPHIDKKCEYCNHRP